MRIASWNVNSLKARKTHLFDWLAETTPDVVCLQEIKCETHAFAFDELLAAGYHSAVHGQKTYNGVAIVSRTPPANVEVGMPEWPDPQSRIIAATFGTTRVICAYVPNGQSVGSEKYAYKLAWFDAFIAFVRSQLVAYPELLLLGDFNVAPEDRDVHSPMMWAGQVLVSEPERAAWRRLLALGLVDSFRLFEQAPKSFSWWDYRMGGFARNQGVRIDHILVSEQVRPRVSKCWIDVSPRKLEKPSDHAPILAEVDLVLVAA
jgi:exodeoxyribonuclease III